MTTNERIKEIAEKAVEALPMIENRGLQIEAFEIIEQAIIESTKDLSATIEAQKKEIEVLDSRMKYLTRQIWDTRYIYGFNEQIKDMDYERLIGIAAEINSGNFTAIDSAISNKRNEL